MALTERSTLVAEYYREGYNKVSAVNDIDKEICENATCEQCGRKNLDYIGLRKDGAYVAIAACPTCGMAEEF